MYFPKSISSLKSSAEVVYKLKIVTSDLFFLQVRYCGEVLSWMAECFAQSTLKCGKDAPRVPSESKISEKNDSNYAKRFKHSALCLFDVVQAIICHSLASLAGDKTDGAAADASQSQTANEAKQEEKTKPGHPGYGANKKFPYIDE